MTLGSWRAPPLLAPFIKQPSCWFSSGPSQQALAQGRARGQRGFGQRRREVCSRSAAAFPASSTTYSQSCVTPQVLPAKPAGPDLAGMRLSLNISQSLHRATKKQTLNNAPSHLSKRSSVHPTKSATSITFP